MVKISQLLLRTEQSSISRPLNLGRDKVEDEDARRDEDLSRDAIFKAEVASFVKHKETYKSNKRKDNATLWRQCQLALQSKIQN